VDEIVSVDLPRPRTLDMMTTDRFGQFVSHLHREFGAEVILDGA
jgi:hypothetical protein